MLLLGRGVVSNLIFYLIEFCCCCCCCCHAVTAAAIKRTTVSDERVGCTFVLELYETRLKYGDRLTLRSTCLIRRIITLTLSQTCCLDPRVPPVQVSPLEGGKNLTIEGRGCSLECVCAGSWGEIRGTPMEKEILRGPALQVNYCTNLTAR
jgi:hypothetical protein